MLLFRILFDKIQNYIYYTTTQEKVDFTNCMFLNIIKSLILKGRRSTRSLMTVMCLVIVYESVDSSILNQSLNDLLTCDEPKNCRFMMIPFAECDAILNSFSNAGLEKLFQETSTSILEDPAYRAVIDKIILTDDDKPIQKLYLIRYDNSMTNSTLKPFYLSELEFKNFRRAYMIEMFEMNKKGNSNVSELFEGMRKLKK
jgi:hypothetical protein